MRPTLGQMVTKLAYDKYGHLAEGNGGSAVVNPEAMEMAQQLWAESGGDKTHAMAAIPVGHPLKIELVRAIEKLASRRM
ncbi:MAG: hypothetical protein LBU89_04825 [Fibromonadaceae bacterium]|nr:hypothetical protein [Fibromonadaceae bacterium]